MATRDVSRVLWAAVVRRYPMREQIAAAAKAGFDKLAVPPDMYFNAGRAGLTARDLLNISTDHGIALDFMDGFSSWLPISYTDDVTPWVREVLDVTIDQCLEICSQLQLKSIVALGYFEPGRFELPFLVERFAAFCDRAAAVGVRVDLEFMPIYGIRDLHTAWQVVKAANRPNGGILLDTWHFMRGKPDLDLLRQIPAGIIENIQLADGYKVPRGATLEEDAFKHRKMPGLGEFPMVEILSIMVQKGGVRSVGPEIFYLTDGDPKADEAAASAARTTEDIMLKAGSPLPFKRA